MDRAVVVSIRIRCCFSRYSCTLVGFVSHFLNAFAHQQDDYKDDKPETTQTSETASDLLPATLDLMDQMVGAEATVSADLLGLTSNDGDEFGDFMSAAGQPMLPYMPSQLLLDDVLSDLDNWSSFDGAAVEQDTLPQKAAAAGGEATKSKNAIMDLFGRGAKKSVTKNASNKPGASGSKANWMDLFAELDPLANPDMMEQKLGGSNANSQAA